MLNRYSKQPSEWFRGARRNKPERDGDIKNKERLDRLLLEKGLVQSRARAQALILSGSVWVDGQRVDKAGTSVSIDSHVEIKANDIPYVSRGGLKLKEAIDEFNIDLRDKVVLDVGAGTGGFTDCLLQHGAKTVYALDVGYGQLHFILRQDSRVIPLERQNIRYLRKEDISDKVDMVVIDVSFISLKKVIPPTKEFMKEDGEVIALIKPQFEVGKGEVGKGGVVRDVQKHLKVVQDITYFSEGLGFKVVGVIESPILGPKGNKEFLMYLRNLSV
jgi:23S rRNA (cytidine1920-2'-O)/16S rRNA (cytidine1409-2'-O)-methyltransferase